jgi:hypothetical protein
MVGHRFAGAGKALVEFGAVDRDRFEDAVAGARQAVGELAAADGDGLGDAGARLVELVVEFLAAEQSEKRRLLSC